MTHQAQKKTAGVNASCDQTHDTHNAQNSQPVNNTGFDDNLAAVGELLVTVHLRRLRKLAQKPAAAVEVTEVKSRRRSAA